VVGRARQSLTPPGADRTAGRRFRDQTALAGMRSGIVSLVYLVVGVAIASSHHYFEHASTLKPILSALLAIVLWPLLLVGINLHIK